MRIIISQKQNNYNISITITAMLVINELIVHNFFQTEMNSENWKQHQDQARAIFSFDTKKNLKKFIWGRKASFSFGFALKITSHRKSLEH